MNSDISIEPLLNRKQKALGSTYVDQMVIVGAGGVTTNRAVTLVSTTPLKVEPSADVTEIHFVNNSGTTFRYGGSAVSATTGGLLYSGSTLAIKSPMSTLDIYFVQASGGDLVLDIVEFY